MISSISKAKKWYSNPLRFLVIVGLLISMVGLAAIVPQMTEPAAADGGDFVLDFTASAPYTYDHSTGGGAFNDRTIGKYDDVVESLTGGDYDCDDIVPFLTKISHTGDDSDDPQTIEIDFVFGAQPTGQPGVGFIDVISVSINYGDVENGDDGTGTNPGIGSYGLDSGINDDRQTITGDTLTGGSNAIIIREAFSPIGTLPFGTPPTEKILLTVQVDGLEAGETVILRVDVRLGCDSDPNTSPTGNVQAAAADARVVDPVQDTINVGQQTISLKDPAAVQPPPQCTITAEPTTPICEGGSVTLTAGPTNGYTYNWSTGQTTPSIIVSPNVTTIYSVTVTDISTGRSTTCPYTVVVNPSPSVTLSGDDSFCDDSSTLITATPSGGTPPYSYDWSASTAAPVATVCRSRKTSARRSP